MILNKIPVSALIMTKNEEVNIRQCLESVKWADDIAVVDSNSTDKTIDIVKEYTDKIYQYIWDKKWPKKNWSLEKPSFKNDWILMIDADEMVTPAFKKELEGIVLGNDSGCAGYIVNYHYYFLGRIIRFGDPVRKLILFRKSKTHFERYDIEGSDAIENLETAHEQPIVNGNISRMKSPIIHADMRPLYFYFDRHNRYSTWEAILIYKEKYKEKSRDVINAEATRNWLRTRRTLKYLFLHMPFKPLVYFVYSYFFRLGFLDGYPGFAYNVCKAFYAFQIGLKTYEYKIKKPDGKGTI